MCTRVFYVSPGGLALTGRTLDWFVDMPSDLWAFPRGVERHGAAGPRAASWTSRYGSVGVGSWHAVTTDGMNDGSARGRPMPSMRLPQLPIRVRSPWWKQS